MYPIPDAFTFSVNSSGKVFPLELACVKSCRAFVRLHELKGIVYSREFRTHEGNFCGYEFVDEGSDHLGFARPEDGSQ